MLKNLSDNLNTLMARARINSSELARLTGLPATTIKRIRNNEQSNPTVSTLLPIAEYFSMTISELLACEGEFISNINPKVYGLKSIPLLSWRECVQFSALDYIKINQRTPIEKNVSDRSFSLRVEESDLAFFPENALILVEPEMTPESSDFVIVAKTEHGRACIKKYIIEADQIYLKSLVKGIDIVPLTSEYKILGVIVQYRVELKQDKK
ncbi:MAG: helix-turn-helix domain-containing protein [Tatlockia sp.]|nr:helix-turn-helix domain-containing protein [Tatlockia sp.]